MDVRYFGSKLGSWVAPVTMVCFVIGALLAIQFTTQRKTGTGSRYGRADVLNEILAAYKTQVENQNAEIKDLRAKLNDVRKSATNDQGLLASFNKQLTQDQIALGLVEVTGPGIAMTLDDSTLAGQMGENKEPFLIHDYDFWPVVNELRSAGAEAISINGQRVVGTTAIRCVGSVVRVNDVPIAAPFTIKAIGDAPTLSAALSIPGGVIEQFQATKFPVKVETRKDIVIEPVGVAPKFKFTQVVTPEK